MVFLKKEYSEPLIGSVYYQVILLTKPLILVLISFLAFALVYSSYSSSAFWAFAAGPINCSFSGTLKVTCCQDHIINQSIDNPAGTLVTYCTDCDIGPGGYTGTVGNPYGNLSNCSERYIQAFTQDPTPTPTPPLFGREPPEALENLQTLEQVPTTPTPPPLFGRNIPQQTIVPQFPVVTPVLTPPPTGDGGLTGVAPSTGEAAPLTDRGPASCPVGNVWDPNLMICVPDLPPPPQLCPDGSIPQSTGPGGIRPECPSFKAEQPEIQEPDEPEDEGQEEPNEGQETAGPLT
jgi:hypothetical protein